MAYQNPLRLHSSHGPASASPGYNDMPAPGSSHGYPAQAPITPVTSNTYPPPPPPSSGYYGLASNPSDHMPSPPPSSNGRPAEHSLTFTPEGAPIVPVGVSGGKMFRCRGFGECDKVFTRSEHLARHVRKHTGERPFPCHCGKAFSRLDNLRQHAATVHADHAALNEAMLNSLAPVHANLANQAGREQRKRGEIVEVPKNAVERPRHNEYRAGRGDTQQANQQQGEFGEFQPGWEDRSRPGYAQPYPYPDQQGVQDNGGPSRRPPSSSGYPYQYGNYDQNRPPTAGAPSEAGQPVPYPYRPMSASGRELPVPQHYAESEPPVSAHGAPPQSPMYPPAPQGQWSSPTHSNAYPHQEGAYPPHPPAETYYEHQTPYGPPPPGSSGGTYAYPPPSSGYYPPGPTAPPSQTSSQGPYAQYPYPGNPSESPFQYSAPDQQSQYPYGNYDRKRRAEDENDDSRKMPRPASAVPQNLNDAIRDNAPQANNHGNANGNGNGNGNGNNTNSEPLWLPPTSERRSSLAISALLGSPRQAPRSGLDDMGIPPVPSATEGATYPPQPYPYHAPSQEGQGQGQGQGHTAESSTAATPIEEAKEEIKA